MFSRERLNALAERRRLLVLEADLHRSLIGLEREMLRAKIAELRATRQRVAAGGGPWLVAGGVIAGVLALRHWSKFARWIPTALMALRWMRSLKGR